MNLSTVSPFADSHSYPCTKFFAHRKIMLQQMLVFFHFFVATKADPNSREHYSTTSICSNATFPVDMSNMQCFGLSFASNAHSLQECQQSCCESAACDIYEWCPSSSAQCSPPASCWIGVLQSNCQAHNGWIGRATAKSTIYTVNTNADGIGPVYGGLGGLSGGGATSRLLWDYEEPYQSQILDYLFKPLFGASLHLLKTEIGGDTFSGCGTESSHMHEPNALSYHQGYEWYMMTQAKKRNHWIKGYGLPWGMPAWIGSGALNENMTLYITNWILGAQNVYNFTIHYIGIWNEDSWTTQYVKSLRQTLDSHGLQHVQMVVADNALSSGDLIVQQMHNDTEFADAVDIIGVHYPSASTSTVSMQQSGKTLWSSEDDSSSNVYAVGGGCLARIINWNYVIGGYTATIVWNLVSSYYPYLRWFADSFMNAAYPYSGYYEVNAPIWIAAHTTQFTYPLDEWNLLRYGNGAGMLAFGGSYVSYYNAKSNDISIVIETMNKNNSLCIRSNPPYDWTVTTQNITFQFEDSTRQNWANRTVWVWKSVLFASDKDKVSYFEKQSNPLVIDSNGVLTILNVEPDSLYTLSTTSGQQKGSHGSPPDNRPFPLPYFDDFSSAKLNGTARYFSDMCGSFAMQACMDENGTNGNCLTQQVLESPSSGNTGWHNQDSKQPLTIIGDYTLSDYQVSAECLFNGPAEKVSNMVVALNLGGALSDGGCGGNPREPACVQAYNSNWYDFGYFLEIYMNGTWRLIEGNNVLLNGEKRGMRIDEIWSVQFGTNNGSLYAGLNNETLFNRTYNMLYKRGWAGLGCGWFYCQFVQFQVVKT